MRSTLSSGPIADTSYQIAPTSEQQQQTTTMEQRLSDRRCNYRIFGARSVVVLMMHGQCRSKSASRRSQQQTVVYGTKMTITYCIAFVRETDK